MAPIPRLRLYKQLRFTKFARCKHYIMVCPATSFLGNIRLSSAERCNLLDICIIFKSFTQPHSKIVNCTFCWKIFGLPHYTEWSRIWNSFTLKSFLRVFPRNTSCSTVLRQPWLKVAHSWYTLYTKRIPSLDRVTQHNSHNRSTQ